MSKKTWVLISCLVLSLTLGLGGSLAYLTDTDTELNTFTMGNVQIDVKENFEKDSKFVPGIDIKKEAWIENTGSNDAYVWMTIAMPKVLEGKTTESAADNIVHINTPGAFWYGYHTGPKYWDTAAQYPRQDNDLAFPVADGYTWIIDKETADVKPIKGQTVTIDGEEYWVMTYLYNKALAKGEVTNLGISKVYLDSRVDYDPVTGEAKFIENGIPEVINYDLNDVKIYVTGYAIQADGFENVGQAYAAFMGQWGQLTAEMITGKADSDTEPDDPLPPITDPEPEESVPVYSLEELRQKLNDAASADDVVNLKLTGGITVPADSKKITVPEGANVVLDLGTHTITADAEKNFIVNKGTLIIKNGTVKGGGSYRPIILNNNVMIVDGVKVIPVEESKLFAISSQGESADNPNAKLTIQGDTEVNGYINNQYGTIIAGSESVEDKEDKVYNTYTVTNTGGIWTIIKTTN